MVLLIIGGRLTDPISTIHLELNIEDNNNTSRSGLIIQLMIHGVDCKSTINNKISSWFWFPIDRMIDSAVSRECKYIIDEKILVNISM